MKKSPTQQDADDESSIPRRSLLKALGIGASVVALDTRTATATSDGYGTHGYGEGGYGDPTTGLTVTTDGASDVGETSAVLTGSLTDLGGASSVDCRFEYRRTTSSTWSATATQTLSASGSFDASVSDLSDGVDYEFRAVASASDGDSDTGSTSGFTTVEDSVSASTDGATDVGETTATLTGSLTDLGNASSADVHFEYREAGSSSWTTTSTQTLTETGSFSKGVTGLASGTDYEFRTVAVASDGDSDTGSSMTFTSATAETDPVVDSFNVSEAGSPNPHAEISVDWAVSDADGNLGTVTVSVDDSTGTTVDSSSTSVSGTSSSGSDSFKIKHRGSEVYDVTLSVEDTAGNVAGETTSVSS